MFVQDLGQLDGPVLLFGGPYSNLPATQALFDVARDRGIGADHMICTGDVVAYCADPAETVAAIRASGCAIVAGNCEKQLAANEMDCGCGFEAGSACDLLSAGWYAHADRAIGAGDRAWMGGVPDIVTFIHQGRRAAVIHGGVTEISRFLWPTSPEAEFEAEIDHLTGLIGAVYMVIAGHCGIPFVRSVGAVDWINAGVIGMPPHDGRPETRYAVMSDGTVTIERLRYDHAVAADHMRQRGLTQGYDNALLSGYWPSEEVLPPDLRRPALASG
ncbi:MULTISPECIES: metallophosphoesterase [unclassified Roseovarius]|uniref:metallophosphoesterase family protein n=1 Tax=unclassified Roseovarius TaxID=2614913 RepID=UPI00273F8910|nr:MULTISPECIES: metallophosphoesterase family protein [unclassified Roseovarius]